MTYKRLALIVSTALFSVLGLQACSVSQSQKQPNEIALAYLQALDANDVETVTKLTHIESHFRQSVPQVTENLFQSFEQQGGIKDITIEHVTTDDTEALDETNQVSEDSTYAKIHLDVEFHDEKPPAEFDADSQDQLGAIHFQMMQRDREWIELGKYDKGWKVIAISM